MRKLKPKEIKNLDAGAAVYLRNGKKVYYVGYDTSMYSYRVRNEESQEQHALNLYTDATN